MTPSQVLRVLLSAPAQARIGEDVCALVRQSGTGRLPELVAPGGPVPDIGFISRDVTGLSTKHRVLPDTQRFYDALLAAPALQWVHIHSAGADRSIYQDLMARGAAVTTSSGANAAVVAQTALAGLLALARQLPRLMAAQREHRWAPLIQSGLPRDLQGQTAVIVGWGGIGQQLARLLAVLGVHVIAVRREAAPPTPERETVDYGQLDAVLPRADWLLLACPLTDRTRHLVNARTLSLLPPGAHLINVARGDVVDEPALVQALASGRLAGAFLDVFAHEPLAVDSPLWDLPNVIATPHSAGFADSNTARIDQMFLDNLRRWLAQAPLAHQAEPLKTPEETP